MIDHDSHGAAKKKTQRLVLEVHFAAQEWICKWDPLSYQLCQLTAVPSLCSEQFFGSKSTADQGRHVAALSSLVLWRWEFVQLALHCRGSPLDRLEAGLNGWTNDLDKQFGQPAHDKAKHEACFFSAGYSCLILPECRKLKRCLKWSSCQNAE